MKGECTSRVTPAILVHSCRCSVCKCSGQRTLPPIPTSYGYASRHTAGGTLGQSGAPATWTQPMPRIALLYCSYLAHGVAGDGRKDGRLVLEQKRQDFSCLRTAAQYPRKYINAQPTRTLPPAHHTRATHVLCENCANGRAVADDPIILIKRAARPRSCD